MQHMSAPLHPAARLPPVQERSQETVQRIHAAASAMLARGMPIETLTTAQIAAEAGLSVGGLYPSSLTSRPS